MDEIIEEGYARLIESLKELAGVEEERAAEIRKQEGALLARMAEETAPLVSRIGLSMLNRARKDANGELYDPEFYPEKMILLGKTEPLAYRPDDLNKAVDTQICVLSEDGSFYELMYSSTEIRTDSYKNPLDPATALDLYGYEIMFMLYRAMREYLQKERELVDALGKTLEYLSS